MKASDLKDYAMIGALFGAGYLLYRFVQGTTNVVAAAGQAVTAAPSKIADFAEILLPHATAPAVPSGATVMLSTGQEIPWSQINPAGVGLFTDTDNVRKIQFYYAGLNWRTTSATPDETNTYYAVPIYAGLNWRTTTALPDKTNTYYAVPT